MELVSALAKQVSQVKLTKVYTADDDPNNLLGRPNGYVGKAAFSDARVKITDRAEDRTDVQNGGGVEVFATQARAEARKVYISGLEAASPMLGSEYLYVVGPALLRDKRGADADSGSAVREGLDWRRPWSARLTPEYSMEVQQPPRPAPTQTDRHRLG